jgi:tRNA (guanine-N7-)-methyltransferase
MNKNADAPPKEKKPKTNSDDMAFKEDFKYSHENPYHDKLSIFDEFVLRDEEGESFAGRWSKDVFKNNNELAIEIGSGYGHFMMEFTQKYPNLNFVGLDHRFKRSFNLARRLSSLEHKSFRYLRARGERLGFLFAENELDKIFYFFPDPWPKARHNKKRLFQKKFVDEAYKVLKKNGEIFVKTDHDEYFNWMVDVVKDDERFSKEILTYDLRAEHPEHFLSSFVTKFEKIFLEKNIKIKAMVLKSQKS